MNSPAPPHSPGNVPELVQVESPNRWRSLVVPAIIVIILLAIAWALFAHFGQAKPAASAVIIKQMAYPVRVDADVQQPASGMQSDPLIPQSEIILLVQARVTNISSKPIEIFDLFSNVELDGTTNRSYGALPEDIDRLFQRFPDLEAMRMQPLARREVIQPGKSVEGLMAFNYNWTQDQWNRRKDGRFVVSFQDARSVVVPLQ